MASTVSLTVKVNDAELQQLKKNIDLINKNNKIKLDVRGVETLKQVASDLASFSKELKTANKLQIEATNASARYTNALANLKKAEDATTIAAGKLLEQHEKTIQSENKKAEAASRSAATQATAAAKVQAAEERKQQELLKTERQVSKNSGAWSRMFSMFSASNLIVSNITRAFSLLRQSFHEAINEMKQLDTAMTHYRQVTGADASTAALLGSQAYSVASNYGTSASDYMESVATYARAGYKEAAADLAELSLKTVIVGQTTQEVADQFLLAMDAAYGYKGSVEKLSKVLDGASVIDSSYATTIEKIATGLGLVAPLAEQVHVSEAELTAAIGTITAATQRSGAEAARALRSLYLNIIKDTTTEIEEGETATAESVSQVQVLLKKYASSAVEAAEATGQVIDPMEAIGAIAQSMKDGLLTEQQLMQMLSKIGGKLRISQLVALISNWDMYTEMIGKYETAMGSADEKTAVYLESWEAKTNILKNTWTEFIANSLNTDAFKGFLDGITFALRSIGDLENGIVKLGSAIASVKLISEGLKSGASWKTWSGAAIGAITAVISAIEMYQQHRYDVAMEEADKVAETAKKEYEEADSIKALAIEYYTAKKAYEDNESSLEQYQAAVEKVTGALDLEKQAIEDVELALKKQSQREVKDAIQADYQQIRALEVAATEKLNSYKETVENMPTMVDILKAITNQDTKYISSKIDPIMAVWQQSGKVQDGGWYYTEEQRFDKMIQMYETLTEVRDKYLSSDEHNGISVEEYQQATEALEDWKDTIGKIIELYDDAEDKKDFLHQLIHGELEDIDVGKVVDELNEEGKSLEDIAEGTKKVASGFSGLQSEVNKATDAMDRFNASSTPEKDDAFKDMASMWNSAMEDVQKGRVNSKNVNNFADLFFGRDGVMQLRKQGIDVADMIMQPFFQEIFTYDGEFTKGEDAGSLFLYKLYDDWKAGSERLGDAIDFSEVDGQLEWFVKDLDELSAAIEDVYGVHIDTSALAVILESLGIFSSKAKLTADSVYSIAEAEDAVTNNSINLEKLIYGKLQAGEATDEIAELLDTIIELAKNGEVTLTIDDGETIVAADDQLDLLKSTLEETIANWDDADGTDAEFDITADDSQARQAFNETQRYITYLNGQKVSIVIGAEGVEGAMRDAQRVQQAWEQAARSQQQATKTTKSAKGQRDFSGGLSIVNEEAPELIIEGDTARIAGSGKPTITYLQPGADVYTAKETKAILGQSYPDELFDGIGAYANGYGGNGVRRWSPSEMSDSGGSSTETYTGGTASSSSPGGTSSSSSNEDSYLNSLKDRIALLKSELELMKARGDSLDDQVAKQRQIQNALDDEIKYLESIGGSQEEINKLYTEWYNVNADIADQTVKLLKSELKLMEERGDSVESQVDKQRQIQREIQKQKESLEAIGGSQEKINELATEWWSIENDINKMLEKQEEERKKAEEERKKALEEEQKAQKQLYEDKIALAKSELALMEAQGKPIKERIKKQREISFYIQQEANYIKSIGGSQEEINKLLKERKDIEADIAKLNKQMLDDLGDAISNKIEKLNKTRDSFVDKIQKEIDALEKERDVEKEQNELEEKKLAHLEAWRKLRNAEAERTVRYWNAKTGQWEWRADANAVASARSEYDSAKQALSDYKREQAYEAKIAKLEAQQEHYTQLFAEKTDKWQAILDAMEEPVITIAKAISNIEKNATKDMTSDIKELNALLKPLGYSISTKKLYDSGGVLTGIGGIKATVGDEMVVPPELTSRMLMPQATSAFNQRMKELSYLYGVKGSTLANSISNSIGSQHNGDVYTFGSITLTKGQAMQTTVYDLAMMSRNLTAYANTI